MVVCMAVIFAGAITVVTGARSIGSEVICIRIVAAGGI
jgi:hypothetical protein